jgi:hypothetical protein
VRAAHDGDEDNKDPKRRTWYKKLLPHLNPNKFEDVPKHEVTLNREFTEIEWYGVPGLWCGEQDAQGQPHGRVIHVSS